MQGGVIELYMGFVYSKIWDLFILKTLYLRTTTY